MGLPFLPQYLTFMETGEAQRPLQHQAVTQEMILSFSADATGCCKNVNLCAPDWQAAAHTKAGTPHTGVHFCPALSALTCPSDPLISSQTSTFEPNEWGKNT